MKKIIIIAAALALASCTGKSGPGPDINTGSDIVIDGETIGKAPAPKVPKLPASLAKKAERLPDLTDPSVPAQQADAIATDRKYNSIAFQLNNIIDAWNCVKKALNDGEDAEKCFKG